MRNIFEPNLYTLVSTNRVRNKNTEQKPGAFKWWTPDCVATPTEDNDATDEVAAGCTGDEPPLVNGWAQPGGDLEKFAFRIHSDGSLEFKGHLDAAGASSGTVAFTLPGVVAGDHLFVLPHDQYFHTVITNDGGTTFSIALVFIDAATGDVTITWPAT